MGREVTKLKKKKKDKITFNQRNRKKWDFSRKKKITQKWARNNFQKDKNLTE